MRVVEGENYNEGAAASVAFEIHFVCSQPKNTQAFLLREVRSHRSLKTEANDLLRTFLATAWPFFEAPQRPPERMGTSVDNMVFYGKLMTKIVENTSPYGVCVDRKRVRHEN